MSSASGSPVDFDKFVERFDEVDWYSTKRLSKNASALLQEAAPLLVEMALQLHPSFDYIYDVYETEAIKLRLGASKSTGKAGEWCVLSTLFQCTLLACDSDEPAVDQFRSEIASDSSLSGLANTCILEALNGNPERAIQYYRSAAVHPQNKSGDQIVGGLSALFYALALLKTKKPAEAPDVLYGFLRTYRNAMPSDRFVPVVEVLFHYAVARSGASPIGQFGWLDEHVRIRCPWQVLFRCVCLYWLQIKPPRSLISQLTAFGSKAAYVGVHWYSSNVAYLRRSYDEVMFGDDLDKGWLLDLMDSATGWETQLQKIETISSLYTRKAVATDSDQRLVWLCSQYDQSIEVSPRLQKLSKKGVWSKGRKINMDDLLWRHQSMDYLTNEDRDFCSTLRRGVADHRGYSFSRMSVVLIEIAQIELLTTMSNLYRSDDFHSKSFIPMKVELREPWLAVVQQPGEDNIIIKLKPAYIPPVRDTYIETDLWSMQWVADDLLQVTSFSDGQMEIASVLSNSLPVPVEAKDRVLNALQMIAPMITVLSDIGGTDMPELLEVEADSTPHMELSPLQDGLRAELKIYPFGSDGPSVKPGQSGSTMLATIENEPCKTTRDIALELQRVEKLLQAAPLADLREDATEYSWDIEDPSQSLELLDALQDFADDIVIEWPRGQSITLPNRVNSSNMSVNVGGSQDWLQVDGELQIGEDRVLQMGELLRLMDSSRSRFVKLGDGSMLALSKRLQSQLIALRGVSDAGMVHPLASTVIDDSTADMNVTGSDVWQQRLKRLREAASLQPTLPAGLNAQLRDYQLEGFQWMVRLAHWGAGACLADDMGLGKTLQSLAVVLQRASLGPTLVIAPTSVCANWEDEIARFASSLNVVRLDKGDRDQLIKNCTAGDVLISSYGLLQNEIESLGDVQWSTIVADEAQAFKNSQTRRSKAMMMLKADFRLITTGTPIENHLGELWNLFRFINPGLLGSLQRFNERFAQPIEVRGEEQARLQLKALVRPFILRRLKRDVLTELPPRTEVTQLIEYTPQEAAFYEALRRKSLERIGDAGVEGDQRFRVLAEITRLRQACCNPQLVVDNPPVESAKLRAFAGIVHELRENGHRCLVFSQFVGHLKLIREYLDKEGIHYQYLDGSTSVKNRKKAVDRFQGGDGELFLISLKAGGSGLNLTAADYVIHMDPWWNPAVEDQASDRAHRMGQTRPVTIYRLVVKDTIEEKIVALHSQKRDLADGLLEGADSGVRLSVDDLMQLLDSDSRG